MALPTTYDPNAKYEVKLNEAGYNPENPVWKEHQAWETATQKEYDKAKDLWWHPAYKQKWDINQYRDWARDNPDPAFGTYVGQEYSDYELAAEQEWNDKMEALRVEQANRPTIVTPTGTQTWTTDPTTGKQTATVTLGEDEQKLYDADIDFKQDVSDIRQTALDRATTTLETPFSVDTENTVPTWDGPTEAMPTLGSTETKDMPTYNAPGAATPAYQGPSARIPTNGDITAGLGAFQSYQGPQGNVPTYAGMEGEVPTYEGIRENVREALLSRVEGDIQRDMEQMHAQLIAQGIPPNSEAYATEMQRKERQLNDARQQAEITATQIASQEFDNAIKSRQQQQSETKDQFGADVTSRQLQLNEKETAFRNQIMERGMKTQEAQSTFDNAITSYGLDRQANLDKWQTDVAAYSMERQAAMDKFATDMQKYGITRQEAIDLFNSEMQTRGMESQEARDAYQAKMATHKQKIANELMERSTALNEMQILTGGQQISIPQFIQGGMANFTPGADYVGISQFSQNQNLALQQMANQLQIAVDNRDAAAVNNILDGMFTLGASVISK